MVAFAQPSGDVRYCGMGTAVSGELTYKGGTSYTLNGRDYPSDDIALIEFVPGEPSAAELNQIPTVDNNPSEHERHVFVTRSGEIIFGKIYHISADGNTFTFDARGGGRRDISSDELARVYVNPAGARSVYASVLNNNGVATSGVMVGETRNISVAGEAGVDRHGDHGHRADDRSSRRAARSGSRRDRAAGPRRRPTATAAINVPAPLSGAGDGGRRPDRQSGQQRAVPDRIEHAAPHDADRRPSVSRRQRRSVRRQQRRVHRVDPPVTTTPREDKRAPRGRPQAPFVVPSDGGLVLRQLDVAVDDPDERFRARDAAELDAEVRRLVPVVPPIRQHLQCH